MKTLLLIAALLLAACSASAPTAPAAVLPTPPSTRLLYELMPITDAAPFGVILLERSKEQKQVINGYYYLNKLSLIAP